MVVVMVMSQELHATCYGNLDEQVPTPPQEFFAEG